MRFTAAVLTSAWLALSLVAGCGGPDEHIPDARPAALDAAVDAAIDAAPPSIDGPPGMACTNGGAATLMVDLGGDAEPVLYPSAWWNHGHTAKQCFEIDVVASTQAFVEDDYLADPHVLEILFLQPPQLGTNTVQVHLHTPDVYVHGSAELTTLDATTVAGTVSATMNGITIGGAFTSPRCDAIYDPCI